MVMMVVFPPTKRVAVQLMKTDLFDCMGIRSAVVTVAVQLKSRAAQEVFWFAGPRLWAYFTESEEMPCRMVYGTQIAIVCYSYSGESKPTNITGGPHIVELLAFAKMFSDPMLFRITGPKKKTGQMRYKDAVRRDCHCSSRCMLFRRSRVRCFHAGRTPRRESLIGWGAGQFSTGTGNQTNKYK